MHSAFNLLVFPNSTFTPLLFFLMKGLCALSGEIALKNNYYYYEVGGRPSRWKVNAIWPINIGGMMLNEAILFHLNNNVLDKKMVARLKVDILST